MNLVVFGSLLQVLFIGLKLGHVIDWAWWQVLIPVEIWGGVVASSLIILGIFAYFEAVSKK